MVLERLSEPSPPAGPRSDYYNNIMEAMTTRKRLKNADSQAKELEGTERIEAIKKILLYQFDLEILQKMREVRVIQEEIERVEVIKELVEKLLLNGI